MVESLELGRRLTVAVVAATLVACVSVLVSCAGAPRAGESALSDDSCELASPPVASLRPSHAALRAAGQAAAGQPAPGAKPIVVALPGPIDPAHAPIPRTRSERLVFSQLYETLIRVTCHGRVAPALADSWRMEADGSRWTFTLRADVRDWRGELVTAADVGSSVLAARMALAGDPESGPWPPVRRVTAEDGRTLVVELEGPASIEHFAHPSLAVWTARMPSGWPIGTGPYLPPSGDWNAPGSDSRILLPSSAGGSPLELRLLASDARNSLDAGVDLSLAEDPDVIRYASSSGYQAVPLGWDRVYLLVVRSAPRSPSSAPTPAALAALARDVVSVAARPAGGFGHAAEACSMSAGGIPSSSGSSGFPERRIVYPVADRPARSLAERLVALALDPSRPDAAWLVEAAPALIGASGGRAPRDARGGVVVRVPDPLRAAGLPAADFAAALRAGMELAYLVPIEGGAADGCAVAGTLVARAPWLEPPESLAGHGSQAIVPLVETRATLLLGPGLRGVVVDDGATLRLGGVRRSTEGKR